MVLATQIKFFFLFEGSNNCTQNLKCRLELVINDINAFLWPETKFVILLFGPYTFFFSFFSPYFLEFVLFKYSRCCFIFSHSSSSIRLKKITFLNGNHIYHIKKNTCFNFIKFGTLIF